MAIRPVFLGDILDRTHRPSSARRSLEHFYLFQKIVVKRLNLYRSIPQKRDVYEGTV